MKSQKLKALEDFLKRAEIIPETLLLISKNNPLCEKTIRELGGLEFEIPFYELNLSDHPNLEKDLLKYCDQDRLPAFVYFRGKNVINKKCGVDSTPDLTEFIYNSKSIIV